MFFIVFGTYKIRKRLGVRAWPNYRCARCGNQERQYLRIRRWFHIFYIPLIPIWTRYFVVCTRCGAAFEINADQFRAELSDNFDPQAAALSAQAFNIPPSPAQRQGALPPPQQGAPTFRPAAALSGPEAAYAEMARQAAAPKPQAQAEPPSAPDGQKN